jgi:hypothetical protein
MIPAMVEYGNGVSQGAGGFSGSHGGGGGSVDVGAAVGDWISNAGHTISTMPPAELAVLVVAVLAGLFLLRRLVS